MKQLLYLALFIVTLYSQTTHAILILNAGFEEDVVDINNPITSYPAEGSLLGWTINSGDVETLTSAFWAPSEGIRSLDLNGVNPASISQELSGFIAGASYELLFDMGGNFATQALSQIANASIGSASQNFTYTPEIGDTISNFTWKEMSMIFTATGSNQTLIFSQVSVYPAAGAALDNIRINLVDTIEASEPSALIVFFIGLTGIALRRQKKLR